MSAIPRATLARLAAALLLVSCGSKTTGPNPPPPPPPPPSPANLVKQAGDAQNGIVGQAVPVPPAVKVTSAAGAAIAGVTVTFAVGSGGGNVTGGTPTTGADGVATVGSWVLGSAAGPNTLTATITGSGVTGNPATFAANAQLTSFNPGANTNLSGTQNFTSVNIPAGVTVTMTGDLALNATGAITIAGNLVGNCVNLTINADGLLTLSGNLNNGCPGGVPDAGAPAMILVGKGGYSLQGPGGFTAPGDVTITNDPTLTDASFAPGLGPSPQSIRRGGGLASVGEPCITNAFTGTANPASAPDGRDLDPTGTDGKDGGTWVLRCKGGSDIVIGALSLTGQNGGRGGNGTNSSATAAVAKGGKGGKGGTVKIQAIDNIVLGGGTVTTGTGGAGGSATATGTGAGGNVGASANATGGAGASPGLFGATAKNGGISILGALNLQIGNGGKGGDATGTGGNGHNAPPCPPAVGGPATSTAGDGGTTPDKTLQAAGAVAGAGNVNLTGGTPGNGGNGVATAGNGGDGAQPCKPGAVGGDPTAKGGKGGDANLKNMSGTKIANGGNGGSMEDKNGKGGHGWIDCILPTFEPGGNGGMGGNSAGVNGAGGSGLAAGTPGAAKLTTVSDGGDGGDGLGPGSGGPAGGAAGLNITVIAQVIQPSFVPGNPGNICTGTFTKTFVIGGPESDLSGHEPILQQLGSRSAQVTIGAVTMSISGLIKNSTIVLTGTRSGANFTLNGSGVIIVGGGGTRNVTVQFGGTIGPNGITGFLVIYVAGFVNPVIYIISDP